MRAIAPAKINLTLEVLGKREDGYHEIRSVMQTVTLIETLKYEASDVLSLEVEGPHEASDDDLVLKAVRALAESHNIPPTGRFRLWKRIPPAAGLGGGSSDAAAVLRVLDRAYDLRTTPEERAAVAAKFSSDAPFFCHGGTALVSGRGEIVQPLADIEPFWMVILVPTVSIPNKTRAMYEALTADDFSDGSRSMDFAEHVGAGRAIEVDMLYNAFDRAATEKFEELKAHRDAFLAAGAESVHLAGSGPALFAPAETDEAARQIARRLEGIDALVEVVRTISRGLSCQIFRHSK